MEGNALYYWDAATSRARGPFSIEQLQEFAELGVIAPDTLVAPEGGEHWLAIRNWPDLCELLFPAAHLHLRQQAYQPSPEDEAALETDAYAVLAINRSREDPDKVILSDDDLRPAMSRRTKDLIFGLALGNGVVLGGVGLYHLLFGANVVMLIAALGFVCIWTAGLLWVTYGVMSRW